MVSHFTGLYEPLFGARFCTDTQEEGIIVSLEATIQPPEAASMHTFDSSLQQATDNLIRFMNQLLHTKERPKSAEGSHAISKIWVLGLKLVR
eukprot:3897845-Rhodomonas_salina.3